MALKTPAFNDAKSYGFEWLRAILEAPLQEGVLGAGDLKVTAAAAGGQRVDIAAGVAFVKGDSGVPGTGLSQGLFMEVNDAAVANAVTLNASDVTNPRIDQIVLRVRDSSDLGSGADDAVFEVVQGVATAGATLDNRTGAAALPNDRLRLADVLVPAGSSAVSAGNVRDRRPWARGAMKRVLLTGLTNFVLSSGSYTTVDAANLPRRLECSGAPMVATFRAQGAVGAAGKGLNCALIIDGVHQNAGTPDAEASFFVSINREIFTRHWQPAPAIGSHLFDVRAASYDGSTTINIYKDASSRLEFIIREHVRQDGDNT